VCRREARGTVSCYVYVVDYVALCMLHRLVARMQMTVCGRIYKDGRVR
jgi:hypothetical protein